MTKLTGAALDRAVAHAMGLKSVHNCEKWSGGINDVHSCSYYCHIPECIEAQRNELRDMLKSKGVEHLDAFTDGWNSALNMAAMRIDDIEAFGTTTRDSFAVYIKSLKKE
jgi:hypothetical protein